MHVLTWMICWSIWVVRWNVPWMSCIKLKIESRSKNSRIMGLNFKLNNVTLDCDFLRLDNILLTKQRNINCNPARWIYGKLMLLYHSFEINGPSLKESRNDIPSDYRRAKTPLNHSFEVPFGISISQAYSHGESPHNPSLSSQLDGAGVDLSSLKLHGTNSRRTFLFFLHKHNLGPLPWILSSRNMELSL